MTTLAILKIIAQAALILLGSYALYRERDLIKFERKAGKYIKAFFKALFYTVRQKRSSSKNISKLPTYRNDEYDEMLARLNKASRIENIRVA